MPSDDVEDSAQPSDIDDTKPKSNPEEEALAAQKALEGILAATEEARPPESFADIPGLNSALLEELDNMDWSSTTVFSENTRRDNMEFVGETPLPCATQPGYSYWSFVNARMDWRARLSRTLDYEHVKFGYSFVNSNLAGAAAEISDVSDQLSRTSTLEDVKNVLGVKNTSSTQLGTPTAFTTAQAETAVLFYFMNGSHRCVIVCFDENDIVCDYVYIMR